MPSIHIIVVVVSPTTLPAPPAFDAATMAARYPIWTLPLKTCRAIVPPISAAAMLSRKPDSTNTMASSARPPRQPSGRNAGISSGMRLFSKCRDRIAKPISSRNRLVRITHSWCICITRPLKSFTLPEPGEEQLVDSDHREPGQRDLQRLVMEDRDAEQRQAEQDEVDRDAEHEHRLRRVGARRGRRGGRRDESRKQGEHGACHEQARARPPLRPDRRGSYVRNSAAWNAARQQAHWAIPSVPVRHRRMWPVNVTTIASSCETEKFPRFIGAPKLRTGIPKGPMDVRDFQHVGAGVQPPQADLNARSKITTQPEP